MIELSEACQVQLSSSVPMTCTKHIDRRGLSFAFLMESRALWSLEIGDRGVVCYDGCQADNTNRAIMTNDGVRGESGISCPDNIETKPAISGGGDVIQSSHCHRHHHTPTMPSLSSTNHHNGSTQYKLV